MDKTTAIKTGTEPMPVGESVWIGDGTVVLPGVTIGAYAVLGFGSVLTTSIPGKAIAFGDLCHVRRYIVWIEPDRFDICEMARHLINTVYKAG